MQGHTYSSSCLTVVVMLLVTYAVREVTAAVATVAAAACDDSAAAPHADVDSLKLDAQASHQPSATAAAAAPDAVVAIHKVSHNTMRVHGRREKWSWLDQV